MAPNKRQDEIELIYALLRDIHTSHGVVFNTRSLRLTTKVVEYRFAHEGISFLTKTLPRLGKALDKALAGQKLSAANLGFAAQKGSELPMFMGELFNLVLSPTGTVLQDPCAESVKTLRQFLYLFYKYELPYSDEQEQNVLAKFERTEQDILNLAPMFVSLTQTTDAKLHDRRIRLQAGMDQSSVAREARLLLERVFRDFDFRDIVPRHGPGAVATRQKLWGKFYFTNVCSRLRQQYPLDEYFYSCLGHVCDDLDNLQSIKDKDLPARVILVPKDSRGPRLISCEPVDFQWIQQGIMRGLVQHIESHPLTRGIVNFTDQAPNQIAARIGSKTGRYATLDLNEASDRVSLDLVRLLFPSHVCEYLEAARSSSTEMPDGRILNLRKFAPMGSALCFPILALTVWAILTASSPDADVRKHILVYGDDVIVPTAQAVNAIEQLESFGLKINRDKSCTSGSFRESCGMDAFAGVDVTPVRLRTVWSSLPSPDVYTSWVAYATSLYNRHYYNSYDLVVGMLYRVYGRVPCDADMVSAPHLPVVPDYMRVRKFRINTALQKRQFKVRDVRTPATEHETNSWIPLLRFFTECDEGLPLPCITERLNIDSDIHGRISPAVEKLRQSFVDQEVPNSAVHSWLSRYVLSHGIMGGVKPPLSVSSYTSRGASLLVQRWR